MGRNYEVYMVDECFQNAELKTANTMDPLSVKANRPKLLTPVSTAWSG